MCNLMLNRLSAVALPGPFFTKSLQVPQSTTTAKGFASANTSLETATYPYIPETKILLLRLASNTVQRLHTLLC